MEGKFWEKVGSSFLFSFRAKSNKPQWVSEGELKGRADSGCFLPFLSCAAQIPTDVGAVPAALGADKSQG